MRLPSLIVAAGTLGVASMSFAAGNPIVTSDLLRVRSASAIDVSWDGARAVVAVRSIGPGAAKDAPAGGEAAGGSADEPAAWANQSHLFLVDLASAEASPRQLTYGHRKDATPVIAPDGRRVAFIRAGADDPRGQVWVMPLDGGEARQVTDLPHGASNPRWSPDGRRLLVGSRIPAHELDGPPPWPSEAPLADRRPAPSADVTPRPDGSRDEIRAWLDANAAADDPHVITRLNFQDERSLRDHLAFTQLFMVDPDAADGSVVRLTNAHRDHGGATFAPGGASIIYVAKERDDLHPDRVQATSLRKIGIDGTADRVLLAIEGWSLRNPRFSRDGSVVAFLGRQVDQPAHRLMRVGIASVTADDVSDPVWLTGADTFDASVWSLEWLHARSALVFNAARRGGVTLMTMSLGLLEPAPLVETEEGFPVGVQRFGIGGGAVVYAVTSPSNPCVLRVRDARGEREVWDLNPWVAEKELATPAVGWVKRPDGLEVQYWVMEPTRRDPTQRYPLAVQIHGGPSAMWGPGEFTMWHEFQLLCSWGYGVVFCNPRGSGGYGYDFRRANYRDWGAGPGGDVLSVVDQVLLTEWVDPERLVVTGGSYGGYLTAWIIANDHRFKAAVAQRGVYDLATFFGEGNAWRLVEWSMGGFPWEPRTKPVLDRESPFTVVNRIRTPLLIMHASNDLRTGVSQSEMLYRALKQLGRPVEYVRYPGAGHDLSRTGDPAQRLDRLGRMIDFFERAIDNPRPAPRPDR